MLLKFCTTHKICTDPVPSVLALENHFFSILVSVAEVEDTVSGGGGGGLPGMILGQPESDSMQGQEMLLLRPCADKGI